MKFRIFSAGGDDQKFVIYNNPPTVEKNVFVFTGFSDKLHPYHKKQWEWIAKILKSKDIFLNIKTVPTIDDISDSDNGEFDISEIKIPNTLKPSSNGKTYFLIQDEEMGRGWSVFIEINGAAEILEQEHRDTILSHILQGSWIRSLGIDYAEEVVENLDNIRLEIKPRTLNGASQQSPNRSKKAK